jgi:oxygen-dependent protoporphyrinogen oxidase
MITNFIGGAQDTGIVELTQEQVVAQVHADLQRILLKPGAPPPRLVGYRLWARAIPQYEV